MDRRVAIILHGPPCTGKTTIANELRKRLRAGFVSLDDGWCGAGGFRRQAGPRRYADLAQASESVPIVEIGCGEPPELTFPGATRAAHEWINTLRNARREVFPFLLSAEWAEVAQRLDERHSGDPNKLFFIWQFIGLNALYERRHPLATFPQIQDFQERPIVTSGRTIPEVVDEIMAVAGLP